MGSIRWRSCAELTQKYRSSPASSVLKRQWSDRSLQARLQEQALRGMSVEVYDGDVGVSVLTLSSSSSALRRGQRSTKAGPEGDVAAQVEAKLLRNESRESQDLHDSLAVEASGSDFEVDGEEEDEAMETDECAPPPPTGSSKVPRPSSRRSRNSSRQRMSRTNKVLSKNKDQDDSVTSTTGRGSGSPVCIKRPLKGATHDVYDYNENITYLDNSRIISNIINFGIIMISVIDILTVTVFYIIIVIIITVIITISVS